MADLTIKISDISSKKPCIKLIHTDDSGMDTLVGGLSHLCLEVDADTNLLQNCLVLEFDPLFSDTSKLIIEGLLKDLPFILIKKPE